MDARRLEEQLECPICLERFRTPRELPCKHTFCLPCLERLDITRGRLSCPECRALHQIPANGVAGFSPNITIQRLLEAVSLPNVPAENREHQPIQRRTELPQSRHAWQISTNEGTRQDHAINTGIILNPTAPPANLYNQNTTNASTDDDLELQLTLEISAEEMRQQNANVARNENRRNFQNYIPADGERQRQQDAHFQNGTPADGERGIQQNEVTRANDAHVLSGREFYRNRNFFQRGRHYIRKVLRGVMRNHETSAVKLGSDCPLERKVAVYLFVKSWFAVFFWGALILWLVKETLVKALDNPFVEGYLVIEALFSLIWLFVGTAWIMGNFVDMKVTCPMYVNDWNKHFINFAMFLTVVDYIGLSSFFFFSGYIICESDEGNSDE